jgi:hypothetical protein
MVLISSGAANDIPDFKVVEFDHFKTQAGIQSFMLSVSEWIEKTNAVGIIVKKGKCGGTYAYKVYNTTNKKHFCRRRIKRRFS